MTDLLRLAVAPASVVLHRVRRDTHIDPVGRIGRGGAHQVGVSSSAGPSSATQRIGALLQDEQVAVLQPNTDNEYYKVRTRAGRIGWAYGLYLVMTDEVASGEEAGPSNLASLGPDEMRAHFIDVGQGREVGD